MAWIQGRLSDSGSARVELDANGNGSAAVNFSESFVAPPPVLLAGAAADAATLSADGVTEAGFTLNVQGSDVRDKAQAIVWVAVAEA